MKNPLIIIALCLIEFHVFAQDSVKSENNFPRAYIAPGTGMDQGGVVGINAMGWVDERIGLFVGVGYNLVGFGFNAGARIYLTKVKVRSRPYLHAMYGYNAVVKIIGSDQYNKMFYGPTVGFGIDIGVGDKSHAQYFAVGLNIPIRKPEVQQYIDNLNRNHVTQNELKLMPVALTLAYRLGIKKDH